jgi:hypothetical protein
MTTIDVHCLPTGDGAACAVVVTDADGSSDYRVTVTDAGFDDQERLVRETFVFLLEREPRASILPTFDLSVVRRYFPEYDDEIHHRMARPAR